MPVLNDLWLGNLCPCEHAFPHSQKYNLLQIQRQKLEEQIRAALSEADRPCLDAYEDTFADLTAECYQEAYIAGFKLGARFIMEIFQK